MAAPPARTGPALPGPGHAPHPPLSRQAPLAAQTVSRQPPQVIRVTSVATPPGGGRALTSEIPVIPASSELKTRSRAATVSSHTRWVRAAGLLSSGLLRPLQASHPRGSFLPRT
ncbi:MHC class II regulatory factor RFX1-like isoform X2 [Cavia porcellus]|uniref:MHC class II regulatory factor RFX1-like isoform X2 n=1 Tax=Cavia porcellus TaxID=10141 RepID=UPI002FE16BF1